MSSRSTTDTALSDTATGEAISALLDDQGTELDVHRVLKRVEADPDVRAQWQRYHMASRVMRGDADSFAGVDLSAGVMAAIELEAPLASGGQTPSRKWLEVLTKSSIAATVAFGFILGVQQFSSVGSPAATSAASLAESEPFEAPDLNSAVVPAGFDTPQLSARTVSTGTVAQNRFPLTGSSQAVPAVGEPETDPELKVLFDRLMMIHAEQVSDNSDLGVLSFARLSGYETEAEAAVPEAGDADAEPLPAN